MAWAEKLDQLLGTQSYLELTHNNSLFLLYQKRRKKLSQRFFQTPLHKLVLQQPPFPLLELFSGRLETLAAP